MGFKLIGSILLVAGTSIGAGLLALPVATAAGGFASTSLILFLCWLFMTIGAFFILEVTLRLPINNNLVSMAKHTLGPIGSSVTWIVSLLLLYSLIAAYISGGTDIVHQLLFSQLSPKWISTLLFTVVFGFIVFKGVKFVDVSNRAIMIIKLSTFFILLLIITPHVNHALLEQGNYRHIISATMVAITSFGFAVIIPSLRVYLKSDAKKLRIAVAIGSMLALFCYWFWCMTIQGTVPLSGQHGLNAIAHSDSPVADLITGLSIHLHSRGIRFAVHLFASLSVLTSFLAVSLSLSDFLADGFKIQKKGNGRFIVIALTYAPPLLIILAFPGVFILALEYAGIFCVILLIMLPALMAWKIRQQNNSKSDFQFPGDNRMIVFTVVISIILLIIGVCTL